MIYHYKSLGQDGKTIEGDIEGMSLDNAILLLQKKGITVVDIQEKGKDNEGDILAGIKIFKKKIGIKDIGIFEKNG